MENKTLPIFKPCTDKAYAECFLQFAIDAKKHIKTQDDATWLSSEIRHIKGILKHRDGEMAHTLTRHIPTMAEQVITSVMRRANDKLRSADQIGYTDMVGADIIPLYTARDLEITAAEIKVVSFSAQQSKGTQHGLPYQACVKNLENKFTSIVILMLDPNFNGKPYRISVVNVDDYDSERLTCRFGDVDSSRGVTFHNPSRTSFPGTQIQINELADPQHVIQNVFYEFNLSKMVKMLKSNSVPQDQINYWNNIFQIVVERSKSSTNACPLPKHYTKTFNTVQWEKSETKTLVATREGHRVTNLNNKG